MFCVSVRNKRRICAYCGRLKKPTVDHIPPKLLIERPFPPNLLTVPGCEDCNKGFKTDDEYTRTVLGLDIRVASHRAIISNLSAIIRSLERPNARAFANYLTSKSKPTSLVTWNGNPIVSMEVDQERINNTGLHIMRGLYYIEFRKPISVDAAIKIGATTGLSADHPDMLTIAKVFTTMPEHRNGETGRTFSYATAFGGGMSFWLMLLYDYFFWAGTIDERPVGERPRSASSH
jgi:hypothetical protein